MAATPLESITPPSPTASSSERTGSHLSFRLSMLATVVALLFVVLLVRLWSIQVIEGSQLNSDARATTTRSIDLQPPRGDIVTSDGTVLAQDVAVEQVTVSENTMYQNQFEYGTLAALFQEPESTIETAFKDDQFSPYTPIPVPTGKNGDEVTAQQVQYIEHHGSQFPGVTVANGYIRKYPADSLASQVLGYVRQISSQKQLQDYAPYGYTNQSQVGQEGLESQYELQLHGKAGVEQVEVNYLGNIVGTSSTTPPRPGDTLVLNMNYGLEQTLTNAIASRVAVVRRGIAGNGSAATPAPWAAGVVLDAQNGAVLAIDSYPSYDNNIWEAPLSESTYSELVNGAGAPINDYAIDGLEPPGSTFKLATATAALNDGLISPGTLIDDPGSFTLGDKTFYDTAESSGAGEIDVSQAITMSNDIFFYQLGAWFWEDQRRYGKDAIQKVAEQYGLGEDPGIDVPGAASGQVDSPQLRITQHAEDPAAFAYNTYEPGDNVEMAFGQGETLVSALQMANAYATFANGGTRYAPELANSVVAPSGTVVERIKPKVLGHVNLPASTYDALAAGFAGVTTATDGTAYEAFSGFPFSKWNVSGKTGTATVSQNANVADTAWFVGFGGPKGEPTKYVVAIEVNEGGYGAEAAAPVARTVFDYLYQHSEAISSGS